MASEKPHCDVCRFAAPLSEDGGDRGKVGVDVLLGGAEDDAQPLAIGDELARVVDVDSASADSLTM